MTDTHTHLYLKEDFGAESEATVCRALEAGVGRLVFPNVDVATLDPMLELHRKFPDNTYIAAGLHPTEVSDDWRNDIKSIFDRVSDETLIAVGEVGMDLYWDKSRIQEQKEALAVQIGIASERGLPMIIHCREALEETAAVFDDFAGSMPQAVFHSFTGNVDDVRRLRRTGDFYFGINGVVTFKNVQPLRDAIPEIGIDRILLETDSPYLAPVPYRGRRNESAYIIKVAEKVAEITGLSLSQVEKVTDGNASEFFRI